MQREQEVCRKLLPAAHDALGQAVLAWKEKHIEPILIDGLDPMAAVEATVAKHENEKAMARVSTCDRHVLRVALFLLSAAAHAPRHDAATDTAREAIVAIKGTARKITVKGVARKTTIAVEDVTRETGVTVEDTAREATVTCEVVALWLKVSSLEMPLLLYAHQNLSSIFTTTTYESRNSPYFLSPFSLYRSIIGCEREVPSHN